MKKATIFFYHFQDFSNKIEFKHNQEIDVEYTFDVAKKISESGLNVMIVNEISGDKVLFVDDGMFKQR